MHTSHPSATLERLLDQIIGCFTPGVARQVAELQVDPELHGRLDELAIKANQGSLTQNEALELSEYLEVLGFVGTLQVKATTACAVSMR